MEAGTKVEMELVPHTGISESYDKTKLQQLLSSCAEDCRLRLPPGVVDKMADKLLREAGDGVTITQEQLEHQVQCHTEDTCLKQSTRSGCSSLLSFFGFSGQRFGALLFLLLYVVLNTVVFYASSSGAIQDGDIEGVFTHSSSALLLLNCSFVALTMHRHLISFIRHSKIGLYLPLDYYLGFHIIVGGVILVVGFIHGASYTYHFVEVSKNSTYSIEEYGAAYTWQEFLFTTKPGAGGIGGLVCISGWALLAVFSIIILGALRCVRKRYFEMFYYTHLLVIPAWALIIVHSPKFILFFALPGIFYLVSYFLRSRFVRKCRYGMADVNRAALLPNDVTMLTFKRPRNLKFQVGDFVWINIPAIAKDEWHPFTISSAPEITDYITIHVRVFGNWTSNLQKNITGKLSTGQVLDQRNNCIDFSSFSQEPSVVNGYNNEHITGSFIHVQEANTSDIDLNGKGTHTDTTSVSIEQNNSDSSTTIVNVLNTSAETEIDDLKPLFQAYIDGPYGESSSGILHSEHAVCIAAGVGVTPFASLLQSLLHHYQQPVNDNYDNQEKPTFSKSLKKIDFFWVNREQKSFQWFLDLLQKLEVAQSTRGGPSEEFLRLHMYVTSAGRGDKLKAAILERALELHYAEEKRDLILGLKAKTNQGRPDWDKEFRELSTNSAGSVTVFYVGPRPIGKVLRTYCVKYNFRFRMEPS